MSYYAGCMLYRCFIYSQGQLDYHTEGLLLLTKDGDYARFLEHPANSIPRRYRALVCGEWNDSRVAALHHPNIVNGIRYQGCLIKREEEAGKNKQWCTMQVTEGKVESVRALKSSFMK